MMYRDHTKEEMEAAIEHGVKCGVSTSHGIKHILLSRNPKASIEPLEGWPSLSQPDLSSYDRLGGDI